jgi:nucleoside-diphosphate-sugar epimerase
VLSVITGVGYTGRRALESFSPDEVVGLSRSPVDSSHRVEVFDLDAESALPLELPDEYAVLYTVPPATPPVGAPLVGGPSRPDSRRDAAPTSGPPTSGASTDTRLQHFLEQLSPVPRRFVYISTTGVYGNRDGAIVTEATQPRPESGRAKRRVIAEQMIGRWCQENDVDFVVLRSPGIYGPGRLGIDRIENGMPILREEDANPGNRIHVDDLVRCCVAALGPDAASGIFNVSDGDQRSTTWFTKEVARQSGLEYPPEVSRRQAIREFSKTRMSFLAESRRIDSTRMREELGVTPVYDNAEEGIEASLDN